MIDGIEIENFRCFKRLRLPDLRRINVLVGDNASGKTAFLEAVFLARAGGPQIALKLRHLRGLGRDLEVSYERQSYESLWRPLFHRFDQDQIISIELLSSGPDSRSLHIFYDKAGAPVLPFGKQAVESERITPR